MKRHPVPGFRSAVLSQMSESDEPVGLGTLPPELLSNILLRLADDDYHMLTLPLVGRDFLAGFSTSLALWAARLGSRLRQVAGGVVGSDIYGSEWALAHAWGALRAADEFLLPPGAGESSAAGPLATRVAFLESAPGGVRGLCALIAHCKASEPPPPPSRVSAEAYFLEVEAKRLQSSQTAALLPQRLTAGDRAAREAAAALNLKGEARSAIRREAAAQARRQVDATCRRQWKLLAPSQKKQWERHAAVESRRREEWHSVVSRTLSLARELGGRLERSRASGRVDAPEGPGREGAATGQQPSTWATARAG